VVPHYDIGGKINGWVVSFEMIYELRVMVDGQVGDFSACLFLYFRSDFLKKLIFFIFFDIFISL
jgi:hypothetical protein